MNYKYIWKHDDANIVSALTIDSRTASTYFDATSQKGVDRFKEEVSHLSGNCYETVYGKDNIDVVLHIPGQLYNVEIKGINALSTENRYQTSQLIEGIKIDAFKKDYDANNTDSVIIRYFNDAKYSIRYSTILNALNEGKLKIMDNPPNSKNNINIAKPIEYLNSLGYIVKCSNWICSKNSINRYDKTQKVIYFIPNTFFKIERKSIINQ